MTNRDDYDTARIRWSLGLRDRKTQVIQELGYDPEVRRGIDGSAWCFNPEKPPAAAPWHDPAALRESAERIAQQAGPLDEGAWP